jgi:photosynthetic reaction center cytochrome c subunit
MVRELNNAYLNPLEPVFPPHRLSPEGDGPKVGCETCHKGVYKPLFGITMLNDYPELAGVVTERPAWWEKTDETETEGESGAEDAASTAAAEDQAALIEEKAADTEG